MTEAEPTWGDVFEALRLLAGLKLSKLAGLLQRQGHPHLANATAYTAWRTVYWRKPRPRYPRGTS